MKSAKQILKFKKIDQDTIIDKAKLEIDEAVANGFPHEVIVLIEREAQGGPCPRCNTPWQRVDVRNDFAEFHYFKPACRCWSVCQRVKSEVMRYHKRKKAWVPTGAYIDKGCGQSKHREDSLGISKCISCGYDPKAHHGDTPDLDSIDQYKSSYGV